MSERPSDIPPTVVKAPAAPVTPPKLGTLVNVVCQVPVELAPIVQRLATYLASPLIAGDSPTAVLVAVSSVPRDQAVPRTTAILKAVTRREGLPEANDVAEDGIAWMVALAQAELAIEAEVPDVAQGYAAELVERTIQGPPGSGKGRIAGVGKKLVDKYEWARARALDALAAGHVQVEAMPGEAMTVRKWSVLLPPSVGKGLKLTGD